MGKPTTIKEKDQCLDAREAHVQIQISKDNFSKKGNIVWVHVDGVCRLRVYAAKSVTIEDTRIKRKKKIQQTC